MAEILPDDLKIYGLLHDAAEAYIGDIPRPLKQSLMFRDAVRDETVHISQVENRIMDVAAKAFGLNAATFKSPAIKRADNLLLGHEAKALKDIQPSEWGLPTVGKSEPELAKLGCPPNPTNVFFQFVEMFEALLKSKEV